MPTLTVINPNQLKENLRKAQGLFDNDLLSKNDIHDTAHKVMGMIASHERIKTIVVAVEFEDELNSYVVQAQAAPVKLSNEDKLEQYTQFLERIADEQRMTIEDQESLQLELDQEFLTRLNDEEEDK